MSLYTDIKHLGNVLHLLRNQKKKSDYTWNFSCPLCGDSRKNKLKARGYVYRNGDCLMYKCHNCGFINNIGELFKFLDDGVYKQWVADSYLEKHLTPPALEKPKDKDPDKKLFKKKKEYAPIKPEIFVGCPVISGLDEGHPAKVYVQERMIPKKFWSELYWTDDFPAFVDKFRPDHGFKLVKEGRILIPCMDRDWNVFAVHGRSINPKGQRYISIKINEDVSKIYGIHRLAKTYQRIYIQEGAFDAMFLPNCIGLGGSDIPKSIPADHSVMIFDNEPWSPTTVAKIEKAIRQGRTVCIWPDSIKQKDINAMVMKEGIKPDKIRTIVDQNLFKGMEAEYRLSEWRTDIPKNTRKDAQTTHN